MKTFKEFIDEKKKDDDEDKDTRSQAVKDAERHDTEDDIFSDRVRKVRKSNESYDSVGEANESVFEGILSKISTMTKEPRVEYSPIKGKDAWQVYVWSPKVKKYIPQGSPHKSEKDAKKDAKGFIN